MFKTRLSVDEFMKIALAPENVDRRLQLIDGEIIEVVSNNKVSKTAARLITFVNGFALPRNIGEMSGADGGYTIEGEQYIPDCAFTSYVRYPHSTTEAYPNIAPDLVVEVLSPGNKQSTEERDKMFRKIGNYLAAGCELWLVYPDEEKLERYFSGEAVRTYRNGDILEGRGTLEGFKLEISTIWPR